MQSKYEATLKLAERILIIIETIFILSSLGAFLSLILVVWDVIYSAEVFFTMMILMIAMFFFRLIIKEACDNLKWIILNEEVDLGPEGSE